MHVALVNDNQGFGADDSQRSGEAPWSSLSAEGIV